MFALLFGSELSSHHCYRNQKMFIGIQRKQFIWVFCSGFPPLVLRSNLKIQRTLVLSFSKKLTSSMKSNVRNKMLMGTNEAVSLEFLNGLDCQAEWKERKFVGHLTNFNSKETGNWWDIWLSFDIIYLLIQQLYSAF